MDRIDSISGTYRVGPVELAEFKRSWPCHGIPDSIQFIVFDFELGNLVKIVASDDSGRAVDTADFDGPALVALAQDAKELLAAL